MEGRVGPTWRGGEGWFRGQMQWVLGGGRVVADGERVNWRFVHGNGIDLEEVRVGYDLRRGEEVWIDHRG